jgi:DNA-binding response OmpR family regulator
MKNAKRILIVEDDTVVANVVAAILKDGQDRIVSAGTIKDAEKAIAQGAPDIIILDRRLPDGDGIQLFRKLKADPALHHVPVLVLSGMDAAEDQAEGLDLGADDYVTKPFDVPELRARVHALLRRAENFSD